MFLACAMSLRKGSQSFASGEKRKMGFESRRCTGPWIVSGAVGLDLVVSPGRGLKRGSYVPALSSASGFKRNDLLRQSLYLPIFLLRFLT